jgi:hypothetical protein
LHCPVRIIDVGLELSPDIRQNASVAVLSILYDMPFVIWAAAGFMMFLQWYLFTNRQHTIPIVSPRMEYRIQLQERSGMKELKTLAHLKPVLIGFVIVCLVILPPISAWKSLVNALASSIGMDQRVHLLCFCKCILSYNSLCTAQCIMDSL